ncbi:MAG: hypothetical protein AAB786_02610 [Patescibacteria group bacterium]
MKNKNKQSGFLQIIILIIIVLFIMKFSGVTISNAVNWFKVTFSSVFK